MEINEHNHHHHYANVRRHTRIHIRKKFSIKNIQKGNFHFYYLQRLCRRNSEHFPVSILITVFV